MSLDMWKENKDFLLKIIFYLLVLTFKGTLAGVDPSTSGVLTKKFYSELSHYGLTHQILENTALGNGKTFKISCFPHLEGGLLGGAAFRGRNLIHLDFNPSITSEQRIGIFLHELGHISDRLWNSSLSRFFHPETSLGKNLGAAFFITAGASAIALTEEKEYYKHNFILNKCILKTTVGLAVWLLLAKKLSFLRTEFIADKSVVQLRKKLNLPSKVITEFKSFLTNVHNNNVKTRIIRYPHIPPILLKLFQPFYDVFSVSPHPPTFLRKLLLDMEEQNLHGFDAFICGTTALLLGGPLISIGVPIFQYFGEAVKEQWFTAAKMEKAKDVEALFAACKDDHEKFKRLTMTNGNGKTLLYVAAEQGHTDVVKVLLAACPEDEKYTLLTMKDKRKGNIPLHTAAYKGNTDVVEELLKDLTLEQKFNLLKMTNTNCRTPLHVAAFWGKKDVIKELLKDLTSVQKFDLLKIQDGKGWAPLHVTALFGHADVVEELLKGLSANQKSELLKIQDCDKQTAFNLAKDEIKNLLRSLSELSA